MIFILFSALLFEQTANLQAQKADDGFPTVNYYESMADYGDLEAVTDTETDDEVDEYLAEYFEGGEEDRILGGRYAENGEYPYIVAVSRARKPHCSGSILSSLYIVTACHCVVRVNLADATKPTLRKSHYSKYRVIAGSLSNVPGDQQGFQLRWIFDWFHHPNCTLQPVSLNWVYDAGIIVVTERFVFNSVVQPVNIPLNATKYTEDVEMFMEEQADCTVAGWGADETKAYLKLNNKTGETIVSHSRYLKALDSKLLRKLFCYKHRLCPNNLKKYKCFRELRNTETPRLCAWSRKPGNGTACYGDSGGPLVCKGILVGLVSYGDICFEMKSPVVFTRVDLVHSFVMPYYSDSCKQAKPGVAKLSTSVIISCYVVSALLDNLQ